MQERTCVICRSSNTRIQDNHSKWYHWDDFDFICHRCYCREVLAPKHNPRRINFKGKSMRLKENPRRGYCVACHRSIGDEYIDCKGKKSVVKRLAIHHISYHSEDILKNAIELCVSCHRKIHHIEREIRLKNLVNISKHDKS